MAATDSSSSITERLAVLPSLAAIPRQQLEWLVAHGTLVTYGIGQPIAVKGEPIPDLSIVLSGRFAVRVERGGFLRKVKEWKPGDVSGWLPYSRLAKPPGDVVADEPVEVLRIPASCVREMIRECHEFTTLCVHEMLDRARQFKSDDLQSEKLRSLGRLSAGLAHELNNPAAAVVRSAKDLALCRDEIVAAARALGAAGMTAAQMIQVQTLNAAVSVTDRQHSPLGRADHEDEIARWLEDRGLDGELAETLAGSTVTLAELDAAEVGLKGPCLDAALRFVAADFGMRRLTLEIEKATSRIQTLVAAVKNYTHMDRAPAFEPMPLASHLSDTLTLLGAKARSKGVTLELSVEPGLPPVLALAGELNQVWLNLVDNAIDAVPKGGHVTLAAARTDGSVRVSVIDDGHGIPADVLDRIFEPFFTTKAVGEGTGLGLDIVLGIVHRHHGTIEPTSKPGRTEFRVTLPAAEAPS